MLKKTDEMLERIEEFNPNTVHVSRTRERHHRRVRRWAG